VKRTVAEQDVFKFIFHEDIKPGDAKIPADVIYERYTKYTSKPIGMKAFLKQFRKFFKQKRTNFTRYFELDPQGFNLPIGYSIFKKKYMQKYKKVEVSGTEAAAETSEESKA
jgi:hypothetical protein